MIKKLYPNGKSKAFNVSYDDGVLQDVRFVNLLNQYGLKGTFNLNSGLMENEFEWIHETGCIVKRLSKENVLSLYNGHEVSSHTLTHPFMQEKTENEIMKELEVDKKNLEKLFGRQIKGFAGHTYDFDTENMWDKIETILKKISLQKDILPMTTIEIIDYLKAMEQVEITESHIINNSEQTLWFLVDNVVHEVKAKRKLSYAK